MKIILASASPRRNEMLKNLNIQFEKVVSSVDEKGCEVLHLYAVEDIALQNALAKARSASLQIRNAEAAAGQVRCYREQKVNGTKEFITITGEECCQWSRERIGFTGEEAYRWIKEKEPCSQQTSCTQTRKGSEKDTCLVIGADTIVVYGDTILDKPKDRDDARKILRTLSGKQHRVITAIALILLPSETCITGYEETLVTFRELSEEDIELYIATGEPMDKAGAYGIQHYGAFIVEKVEGDYFNVVGLPILKLYRMMKTLEIDLFEQAAGKVDR